MRECAAPRVWLLPRTAPDIRFRRQRCLRPAARDQQTGAMESQCAAHHGGGQCRRRRAPPRRGAHRRTTPRHRASSAQSRAPAHRDPTGAPSASPAGATAETTLSGASMRSAAQTASPQHFHFAAVEFYGAADRLYRARFTGAGTRPFDQHRARRIGQHFRRDRTLCALILRDGPAEISTTSAPVDPTVRRMQSAARPHSIRREMRAPRNCRCAKSSSSRHQSRRMPVAPQPRLRFHDVQQRDFGILNANQTPHGRRQ